MELESEMEAPEPPQDLGVCSSTAITPASLTARAWPELPLSSRTSASAALSQSWISTSDLSASGSKVHSNALGKEHGGHRPLTGRALPLSGACWVKGPFALA